MKYLLILLVLTGCDSIQDAKLKYSIQLLDSAFCKSENKQHHINLKHVKSLEVEVSHNDIRQKYDKINDVNDIMTLQSKNNPSDVIIFNKKEGTLVKLNLTKSPNQNEFIIQTSCR